MLGSMSLKYESKNSIELNTLISLRSGVAKAYKATRSLRHMFDKRTPAEMTIWGLARRVSCLV